MRRKMIAQRDYDQIYAAAETQSKMLSWIRQIALGGLTLNSQPKPLNLSVTLARRRGRREAAG
jgi:hypothetical protein